MSAIRGQRANRRFRPAGQVRDSRWRWPFSTRHRIRGWRFATTVPAPRSITSAALLSSALIAVAVVLILVLLPALLGAAGAQAASAP